jgi:hypothetical protein
MDNLESHQGSQPTLGGGVISSDIMFIFNQFRL